MSRRTLYFAIPALMILIFAAAVLIVTRKPDDPFQGDAIVNPAFPSLSYGIQAFLWWDGGEVGENLDRVTMMGFTYVKQTFAWSDMERKPGKWRFKESDHILDETERRGLKVIVRLGEVPKWAQSTPIGDDVHDTPPADLDAWANYCGTIASHYKGHIAGSQVWNEPNLSREWGGRPVNAIEYTELLAACSLAIRAADPDAKIISAGLAPTGNEDTIALRDDVYLDQMYKAGFQQYVDAVGAHAPGFSAPDVDPSVPEAGRWASFRRVEDLRKIMIANGDAAHQIAILETGWTTDTVHPGYAWYAVSEADQAKNLRAAYEYAAENWRPWVGLMSMIYIAKPTWTQDDEELWWAITEQRPGYIYNRPAFDALVRMAKYCGDQIMPARDMAKEIPVAPDNPCD
ncbi:MAG TPA: beta-galactosidase [Phototrophicaceae bacterium]|nr:beta-galactosidase [Phototrophicaceae bacterium]